MSEINNTGFYAVLMFIAGLGIPIFATLNGELGTRFQSTSFAAVVSLSVGIITALFFVFMSEGLPKFSEASSVPFYYYFGGLFVVLYILGITWVAPRFGVGNAVSFVLLGQLCSMAIIDHFGLLGALHHQISLKRLAGLCLMALGVFLAVRR